MSRWRNLEKTWCNWPSRPIGLVEVIGGSYLSASPHISYKYFLESLAKKDLAIHAWPYLPALDHQAQANEAWRNFRLCRKRLEARVNMSLNTVRIGHSLGCKLHLLAPDKGRNNRSFIAISFNNFNIERSIPMLKKFSRTLNFKTEFSPSPDETINLILEQYLQSNNLVISFANDKLDQSKILIDCLQRRDQDLSSNIELIGNHLTPVSSGLRQNLLGNWSIDKDKMNDLNILIEKIYLYIKSSSS